MEFKLCKKCSKYTRTAQYLGVDTINGVSHKVWLSECGNCGNRFTMGLNLKTNKMIFVN